MNVWVSALSLLKDQPPLTEQQLSSLCITTQDFTRALRVVQPSAKREGFATVPDVTWADIGALTQVRDELQMAILVRLLPCALCCMMGTLHSFSGLSQLASQAAFSSHNFCLMTSAFEKKSV